MRKHFNSSHRKFSRKAYKFEGANKRVHVNVDIVAAALRYNRRKGVLIGMLPLTALLSVYLKKDAREMFRKNLKEAWDNAKR